MNKVLINFSPINSSPLSIDEVRLYILKDETDTSIDSILTPLILPAIQLVEKYLNRSLVARSHVLSFDRACRSIRLPNPPINSITSIKTFAQDNSETLIESINYLLIKDRLVFNDNYTFTSDLRSNYAFEITYNAGYLTLPEQAKQAILITIEAMFECICAGCDSIISIPRPAQNMLVGLRVHPERALQC